MIGKLQHLRRGAQMAKINRLEVLAVNPERVAIASATKRSLIPSPI
jgi:hypothetical protein